MYYVLNVLRFMDMHEASVECRHELLHECMMTVA
jgi:hypothetical protein